MHLTHQESLPLRGTVFANEMKQLRSFRSVLMLLVRHFTVCLFPPAKPQWVQAVKDTTLAIEDRLHWECRANGKPKPSYTWLKNGQQLLSGVNYSRRSAIYQYLILKI